MNGRTTALSSARFLALIPSHQITIGARLRKYVSGEAILQDRRESTVKLSVLLGANLSCPVFRLLGNPIERHLDSGCGVCSMYCISTILYCLSPCFASSPPFGIGSDDSRAQTSKYNNRPAFAPHTPYFTINQ
ncbi:uncharacterized protein RSE6_07003 [Rhynchosporium secalis]|uniref:Uncharacterized protein n=1 Tax=Rhynchosporium secalis TaxID=38038 RepID=A0A1E1MBU1_RHYSE|nr:uncharacterized protein RSE6_07003 [Rhynchosporium secalis]